MALALAGCASTAEPGPSADTTDQPQLTAYEGLAAEVARTGDVTKSLQLFAMQYGPLPGVPATSLPASPPTEGNLSISAVFDVWNKIATAQQDAVRAALDLPPNYVPNKQVGLRTSPTSQVDNGAVRPAIYSPGRNVEPFRRSGTQVLAALESHLGPLGVPVEYRFDSHPPIQNGAPAFASTLVLDGRCRVTIYPTLSEPTGPDQTLAHEFTHCYQQVWRGTAAMPRNMWWIQEGQAEWASSVVMSELGGATDQYAQINLQNWSVTPGTTLTERTYDAYGFFAYANQTDGQLWSRMRDIATSPTPAAAVNTARGSVSSGDFVAGWASTQFQRQPLGTQWFIQGPGVPSVSRSVELRYEPLANGAVANLSAPAFATGRWVRQVTADTIRISLSETTAGSARLPSGTRSLSDLTGQTWCTSGSGQCTCPAGSARAGHSFPRLDASTLIVGAGGGESTASAQLRGRSLADECGEIDDCPIGTWTQNEIHTIPGAVVTSGGTGTRITVSPDGRVVQSFDDYVPITATGTRRGSVVVHLAPTGEVTGHVDIPDGRFTSSPVTQVNADGLHGSGYTEVGGQRVPLSIEELKTMGFALNASPQGGGGRPTTMRCVGPNELVLEAGPSLRQTYVRAS